MLIRRKRVKNKSLIKYLGIIVIGSILLSCGMKLWAEEKAGEKVWIEVRQDEFGTTKKKYLVTKEERDRIWERRRALGETFNAIGKAYRDKEIDLETKLMYEIKALEEPQLVPEKYRAAKYRKEKPDLKYHQGKLKRVLREVRERWLETRIETHSEIWSSEIFPYLKEDIKKAAERERDMFGYEFLWIPPDDAYIIREIDLDQMMLYIYGPPEEWPAKFIPPERTRIPKGYRGPDIMPSDWEVILPLVRYSRYLSRETKEKIKLYRWKQYRTGVGIGIDSPKEAVGGFSWGIGYPEKEKQGGAKVYTPTVKIKGKIVTPEMYEEVEAWVVVRADGRLGFPVDESREVKEIRKEIKLGPSVYEKPSFFDEKYLREFREYYEKYEKLTVDDFVMEYKRGPGKIIRPFEIELELPYYIGNVITISARNNGGQSASTGLYVTRYDRTDRKPPEVEIVKPKDGAILNEGYTVEGKGKEILVLVKATDDKRVLWVKVYANGELAYIDYDTNRKARGDEYYRLGIPAKIGKNKIKVVAYDSGNNSKSDTVKIMYSPEK